MKELKVIQSSLVARKDLYNSYGKYKYRSAESILEAVKPHLLDQNCTLTLTDEIVVLGEHNPIKFIEKTYNKDSESWVEMEIITGMQRFYIKATATITNSDNQSVSVSAFAREEEAKKGMDGAQVTGSASSYARKYALGGLFCIDDTKDPDSTNDHGKGEKTAPKQPKVSVEQLNAMQKEAFENAKKQIENATSIEMLHSINNSNESLGTYQPFKDLLNTKAKQLNEDK